MFGLLRKKTAQAVGEAKAEVKKIENRDFMEAAIGIMILVSAASAKEGDKEAVSAEELQKLQLTVETLPELQGFGNEIGKTIDKFMGYFSLGFKLGKNRIMREIRDVKANEREKEDILALGAVAAFADGEIEPAEKAVLEEVAREFGLKIENFL